MRNAFSILAAIHKGKRPIGRPRCILENNIYTGLDWIYLAQEQGPVASSCEPSDSIKGGEFIGQLSDYWLLKDNSASWSQFISLDDTVFM
jgi:hypothetical protein